MKRLLLLPLTLLFIPTSALADYSQSGGVQETACYETVYREEYIPGTRGNPGTVRTWNERVRVPCTIIDQNSPSVIDNNSQSNFDDNSCVEGSLIGGILGGAAGGTLATQENWIWSIPAGLIGGAMVGCQIDGG